MFSKQITNSDAFLDMPQSSQLLYFHLNMEADDDGFVGNPKRIARTIGSSEDDMKILLVKRFVLAFQNGVVVIKHWLLHNAVRKDMYRETQYLEEKKALKIKENGAYTEGRNELVTGSLHRIGKDRIGKDRIGKDRSDKRYSPEDLKSAELLYQLIKEKNPAWYVKPNWDKWAEDIRKIREIDGRTTQQIDFVINWSQNDKFWHKNILSPEKLRKQFNTLVVQAKAKVEDSRPKMSL